jgi:hypothetical protein
MASRIDRCNLSAPTIKYSKGKLIGATAYPAPVRSFSVVTRHGSEVEETTVDRQRAHLVLRTHVGGPDWIWLGLRRRCRYCGQRFPCPPRQGALRYLTSGR